MRYLGAVNQLSVHQRHRGFANHLRRAQISCVCLIFSCPLVLPLHPFQMSLTKATLFGTSCPLLLPKVTPDAVALPSAPQFAGLWYGSAEHRALAVPCQGGVGSRQAKQNGPSAPSQGAHPQFTRRCCRPAFPTTLEPGVSQATALRCATRSEGGVEKVKSAPPPSGDVPLAVTLPSPEKPS